MNSFFKLSNCYMVVIVNLVFIATSSTKLATSSAFVAKSYENLDTTISPNEQRSSNIIIESGTPATVTSTKSLLYTDSKNASFQEITQSSESGTTVASFLVAKPTYNFVKQKQTIKEQVNTTTTNFVNLNKTHPRENINTTPFNDKDENEPKNINQSTANNDSSATTNVAGVATKSLNLLVNKFTSSQNVTPSSEPQFENPVPVRDQKGLEKKYTKSGVSSNETTQLHNSLSSQMQQLQSTTVEHQVVENTTERSNTATLLPIQTTLPVTSNPVVSTSVELSSNTPINDVKKLGNSSKNLEHKLTSQFRSVGTNLSTTTVLSETVIRENSNIRTLSTIRTTTSPITKSIIVSTSVKSSMSEVNTTVNNSKITENFQRTTNSIPISRFNVSSTATIATSKTTVVGSLSTIKSNSPKEPVSNKNESTKILINTLNTTNSIRTNGEKLVAIVNSYKYYFIGSICVLISLLIFLVYKESQAAGSIELENHSNPDFPKAQFNWIYDDFKTTDSSKNIEDVKEGNLNLRSATEDNSSSDSFWDSPAEIEIDLNLPTIENGKINK